MNLPNKILSQDSIELAVLYFDENILSKLEDDQYILVIFKVITSDKIFRNISYIQTVNKNDIDLLSKTFIEYWNIKAEDYNQLTITDIIFNYRLLEPEFNITASKIHLPKKDTFSPNILKIGSYNFPCTMDLFLWGNVDFINYDKEAIVYKKHSSANYNIKFNKLSMYVEYTNNGNKLLEFNDTLMDINNLVRAWIRIEACSEEKAPYRRSVCCPGRA